MEDNFFMDQGEWDDFEMIQSLYLLWTLFLLLLPCNMYGNNYITHYISESGSPELVFL